MYLTAQSLAAFAWRDQGSKIDMYCKIQGSEGPDSFFCGDNLWTGLAHVSACTAMCDNTTVTTASYDLVALQTTLMGTNAFCKSHVPMCLKFEDELPGRTRAGCHEPWSHGAVEPGNPDKPSSSRLVEIARSTLHCRMRKQLLLITVSYVAESLINIMLQTRRRHQQERLLRTASARHALKLHVSQWLENLTDSDYGN